MRLIAIAALAGCYSAPSSDPACTLLCTDACPGDMQCVSGYCVGDGDHCEPAFSQVAGGNGFVCALDEQKRRWCWGANDQHQLDPTSRLTLPYATLVDNGPWDSLATGGDHSCGVRDGELYCWGGNDRQQVSGTISGDVAEPLRIEAPNHMPWSSVVTGFATTCGIAGETLYCWGANNRGQAGVSSTTADIGAPTQVGELRDWTLVAVGREHACGVSASAGLMCWGYNYYGQLGDGSTVGSGTPKAPVAVALPNVTSLAVAGLSTCAVAGGQLQCWGRSAGNALGDPMVVSVDSCVGATSTPIAATTLDGWTQLAASRTYTCGLRAGELYCWGSTASGIGNGVWGSSGFVKVADNVSAVTTGWNTNFDDTGGESDDLDVTCFIAGGAIRCWGDNRFGQLAQGAATMAPQPVEIAGNHQWATLAPGDSHACGIDTDGVPMCWGTNASGQLDGVVAGNGANPCDGIAICAAGAPMPLPFSARADAIALGDDHTCALDASTLTCWGSNSHLQLGSVGATSPSIVPGTWTGLYLVGGKGQCAAQGSQTFCWGSVTGYRQAVAHDARFDGAKSIGIDAFIGDATAAGNTRTHGCALGAGDQLSCFGVNTHGQFGSGAPALSCGNGVCDVGEDEDTCADCVGKLTCTPQTCGGQSCGPRCGDGNCTYGYGETCSNCASDCGACPYVQLGRSYQAVSVNWNSGSGFTCAIRTDRQVECWGRNSNGQAGALDTNGRVVDPVYTPNVIDGLTDCTAVSAGGSAACAICGGDIYCWGNHRTGAVGAGALTAFPITTPRRLDIDLEDDDWAQLVSGDGYTCARSDRGRGFCWGFHPRGALGTGATSMNMPAPIRLAP